MSNGKGDWKRPCNSKAWEAGAKAYGPWATTEESSGVGEQDKDKPQESSNDQ